MKTQKKIKTVTKQASSNLTVLDETHHASPKPDKVTKSCSDDDYGRTSKLPLIRKSPLAELTEEKALKYLARPSTVETPVGIDPKELRAFTCGLIRRRVIRFGAELESSPGVDAVDALWSLKLGTGIILVQDSKKDYYEGCKLRAFTSEAIENAILCMDPDYCFLGFQEDEAVVIDRNLFSEDGLASALAEYYHGTPIQKQGACRAVMQHCIRWVDCIDLPPARQSGGKMQPEQIVAPVPRSTKDKQ